MNPVALQHYSRNESKDNLSLPASTSNASADAIPPLDSPGASTGLSAFGLASSAETPMGSFSQTKKRKLAPRDGYDGETLSDENEKSVNGKAAESLSALKNVAIQAPAEDSSSAENADIVICKGPATVMPKARGSSLERKYVCNGHVIHRVTFWRHRKHGCPAQLPESGPSTPKRSRKRLTKKTPSSSPSPQRQSGFPSAHVMEQKMLRQHLMNSNHGISPFAAYGAEFKRIGDQMRCIPPLRQNDAQISAFSSEYSNVPQVFVPIEFSSSRDTSRFGFTSQQSPDLPSFPAKMLQGGNLASNSKHRFVHSMEGPFGTVGSKRHDKPQYSSDTSMSPVVPAPINLTSKRPEHGTSL